MDQNRLDRLYIVLARTISANGSDKEITALARAYARTTEDPYKLCITIARMKLRDSSSKAIRALAQAYMRGEA